jgi:thymidine phosphorylase
MVTGLGGPADLVEHPDLYLERAPVIRPVHPDAPGLIASIDVRSVGLTVVELGGGRVRAEDGIDHRVGLSDLAGLGDDVGPDRPLCIVHARNEADVARARQRLLPAFRLGDAPARDRPPVLAHIAAEPS